MTDKLQDLINKSHNPNLIIPTESPNGNRICHIYSDGEITDQKGGWAYLKRSETIVKYKISFNYILSVNFPILIGDFGYAIVTLENALLIRDIMIALLKN